MATSPAKAEINFPFFPSADNYLPEEDVQDILDYIMGYIRF
jgi:hypothetical protein